MIACAGGGIVEVSVALLVAGAACVWTKVYNLMRGSRGQDNYQR